MAHIPHILVGGPWGGDASIELPQATLHHLRSVLRLTDGASISYTDGAGRGGLGELSAAKLVRGVEDQIPPPPAVTLAVAPPSSRDRLRLIVEKASEIGVTRVRWLRTQFGQGRPPSADKAASWAQMALEQSRGRHLTAVDHELVFVDQLEGALFAADLGGTPPSPVSGPLTVMVGPEGGWAPGEVDDEIVRITLGDRVLRTETAAILACHVMRTMTT